MKVQKISTEKLIDVSSHKRPGSFDCFLWQEHVKSVLKVAIESALVRKSQIWHILLSGPSWFGKTTLANIIAKQMWVWIKAITGYAINKPADIISILNNIESWEILFIDEIHRLRPNVEEVLYIAMEDFTIDMVMPDWWNIRVPINPFTLIWATTKSESLTKPLKNRFVYQFHFMDYDLEDKKKIMERYLEQYDIDYDISILEKIIEKVDAVPREIHNFCIKVRDFLTSSHLKKKYLNKDNREIFVEYINIKDGWITMIHQKYLQILEQQNRPVGLKTISIQLGINEKAVEEDIEPLLLKLWKIEKTSKWRVLL